MSALIPGRATALATARYMKHQGARNAAGHYSDFLDTGIKLSALGVGTFPGVAEDGVDEAVAQIVLDAVLGGINLIDTGAHYRYGRAARAVGRGLSRAWDSGVAREAVFLIGKGGFLLFPEGPPANPIQWFEEHIAEPGLGHREDLAANVHLMTPTYLRHQIEWLRQALGVAVLDAFLIDQPEAQIQAVGKPELVRRLDAAFVALEQAVREGLIGWYGVSSFNSFRVAQDEDAFVSLTSLVALAERAAAEVFGAHNSPHHFRVIELPFNAVMPEGFTRFNQVIGDGSEMSTLQAALRLQLFTVASHSLFKGHLAQHALDPLVQTMPRLSAAQRALQFNRSTPGLGAALAGMSNPAHLQDLLLVARQDLLPQAVFLEMFQKA